MGSKSTTATDSAADVLRDFDAVMGPAHKAFKAEEQRAITKNNELQNKGENSHTVSTDEAEAIRAAGMRELKRVHARESEAARLRLVALYGDSGARMQSAATVAIDELRAALDMARAASHCGVTLRSIGSVDSVNRLIDALREVQAKAAMMR